MQPVLAKHNLGPCVGCGVNVDSGEWVIHHSVGVTHAGCIPRREAVGKQGDSAQSSGFLFNDLELKTIENARETVGASRIVFDGPSAMQIDTVRLAGQLARVFNLMRDGKFRTLTVIAESAGCLETSASARLRDLRKARFGAHQVVSRQVMDKPGLYEYRVIVNEASIKKHGQQQAA